MTKQDRAKCERIYEAFEAAFEVLPEEQLAEIVNAMQSFPGPIIGGSTYTPRWLYDVAEIKLARVKYRTASH